MEEVKALLESQGLDPSGLRMLFRKGEAVLLGLTGVEGQDALGDWERLRERLPARGVWPVLVGRDGDEDLSARLKDRRQTVADLLAEAEGIDFPAWVEQEHAALIARSRNELAEAERAGDDEATRYLRKELNRRAPWQCMRRAKWPADAEPTEAWMIARRLTHDNVDDPLVTLALVPARHGWEALAVLNFGSQWRAIPQAIHVAAWRYWKHAYGAEVACVTWDTIEAKVAKPPRSRRKALALARAQCLYCPDLETQVYKSVDDLAARLLGGEGWYFWWD